MAVVKTKLARTKARANWHRWYQNNKKTHNAKRKQRYAEDPQFREKVLEAQKELRSRAPKAEADGRQFRKIKGKEVEVFRIGHVARVIERDIQVIRLWEREEKIPKPSIPGGHRYYTATQVELLKEFAQLMTEVRYEPKVRQDLITKKTEELKQNWHKL
jgi:hypothetical protein